VTVSSRDPRRAPAHSSHGREPAANVFAEFLRQQIDIDLERLRQLREHIESGTAEDHHPETLLRGFRECELKTRLLRMHDHCGHGTGLCDRTGDSFPPEDERGCATRALLGLPYIDRPGYQARWRP
jgi:hypothetical protein